MRPRWHDWLIVASIIALAAIGVWTLWGDDLRQLFRPEPAAVEATAASPTGAPASAPAAPPPVSPPPGQAAGPF